MFFRLSFWIFVLSVVAALPTLGFHLGGNGSFEASLQGFVATLEGILEGAEASGGFHAELGDPKRPVAEVGFGGSLSAGRSSDESSRGDAKGRRRRCVIPPGEMDSVTEEAKVEDSDDAKGRRRRDVGAGPGQVDSVTEEPKVGGPDNGDSEGPTQAQLGSVTEQTKPANVSTPISAGGSEGANQTQGSVTEQTKPADVSTPISAGGSEGANQTQGSVTEQTKPADVSTPISAGGSEGESSRSNGRRRRGAGPGVVNDKPGTYYDNIFNIPISTLEAVNRYLNNRNQGTVIQRTRPVASQSNAFSSSSASSSSDSSASSSASSSAASESPVSTGVASGIDSNINLGYQKNPNYDDVFNIPISVLGAVNRLLNGK